MNEIKDLASKAAVLLSPTNKIVREAIHRYRREHGTEKTTRQIYKEVLGRGGSALEKYARGGDYDEKTSEVLSKAIKKLGVKLSQRDVEKTELIEFGAAFGMPREAVQRATDHWMAGKKIPGQGFYLDKNQAKDLFRSLSGVYSVYLPIESQETEFNYMRCALRVRYDFGYQDASDVYSVRCKLNVPALKDSNNCEFKVPPKEERRYFGYPGKIVMRDYSRTGEVLKNDRFFWHFEQNDKIVYRGFDVVSMTTRFMTIDNKENTYMVGVLISVNQDEYHIGYAAPVFIEREKHIPNDYRKGENTAQAIRYMETTPRGIKSLKDLKRLSPKAAMYFEENNSLAIRE